MADPHSLKPGDIVTHPEWPKGTTRTVVKITPFVRVLHDLKGGSYTKRDPKENSVELNEYVLPLADIEDNIVLAERALYRYWMEAGLEKVDLTK